MRSMSIVATCCQLSSTKVDAQCDKLDRRRSTELTIPATVGGWFITLIVHLCLQHDSVAHVYLRYLILETAAR